MCDSARKIGKTLYHITASRFIVEATGNKRVGKAKMSCGVDMSKRKCHPSRASSKSY